MKKIIIPFLSAVLLIACTNSNSTDKKTELENLKKQLAELKEKIGKLEAEVALTDTSQKNDKSKMVAVTEMRPQLFSHYIEVQAKVEGDEDIAVSAEMMGTVKSVLVSAGDHVKKGEVLATLDDKVMQQSVSEVQTQLDLATTVYNRQKNLWDQKIGSEVQYLQAKSNKETLEKRLGSVQQQWEMTRIKSPINGTVDEVSIKIGQAVAPGMPAVRVVNLSLLKVKGELAESDISKVKQGNDAIIYFPDQNKEIKTKVTYSGQAINKLNRTFNVEVRLKPGDGNFHPNQMAILKIVDYTTTKAFVVPVGAIQKSLDGEFVYVAENENGKMIVKRKVVSSGITYNGIAEIKQGLDAGDKVITNGYQNVIEGDPIRL